MKKTHIFSVILMMSISIGAYAQNPWMSGTGGSQTYTQYNVGIGTTTYPTDARLHIYNNQSTVYGAINIPELMIDRKTFSGTGTTDFLQINAHSSFPSATAHVLEVINNAGWLGILTPKPLQPLDVMGNALIEKTLFVRGGLIDMSEPAPMPDNLRSIQANSNNAGLSIFSTTAATNGSAIELYGPTYTTVPGRKGSIHYTSHNTTGDGHVFYNYDGSFHTNLTIQNNGRTLIGHDIAPASTNPNDVLTVRNQMGFYRDNDADWRAINGNTTHGGLSIFSTTSTVDGSGIQLYGGGSTFPDPTRAGSISYHSYGNTSVYGHVFYNYTSSYSPLMGICNNGKVVIGKDLIWPAPGGPNLTPDGYLLYVQTGIMTEKLNVAIAGTGNWSDFVFNKEYNLMPLNKLESYVLVNKHLPDVPAANEVVKDGIDVASMDAKLLQKIEELTLYAINQQKQSEQLQIIVAQQQKEIEELEKRSNK